MRAKINYERTMRKQNIKQKKDGLVQRNKVSDFEINIGRACEMN